MTIKIEINVDSDSEWLRGRLTKYLNEALNEALFDAKALEDIENPDITMEISTIYKSPPIKFS